MNWIEIFNKQYNRQTYNCAHFVSEVYLALNGVDISSNLCGFLCGYNGKGDISKLKQFTKLSLPQNCCIILFHGVNNSPHVGIYLNGKCLHIDESGVQYVDVDLVAMNFKRVGYYKL